MPPTPEGSRGWGEVRNEGLDQMRLDQIRLDQVRLDQIRLDQIRLDQIRIDQIRLVQIRLGQIRLDVLDDIRFDFRLDQPRLDQIRLDSIRLAQIRWVRKGPVGTVRGGSRLLLWMRKIALFSLHVEGSILWSTLGGPRRSTIPHLILAWRGLFGPF